MMIQTQKQNIDEFLGKESEVFRLKLLELLPDGSHKTKIKKEISNYLKDMETRKELLSIVEYVKTCKNEVKRILKDPSSIDRDKHEANYKFLETAYKNIWPYILSPQVLRQKDYTNIQKISERIIAYRLRFVLIDMNCKIEKEQLYDNIELQNIYSRLVDLKNNFKLNTCHMKFLSNMVKKFNEKLKNLVSEQNSSKLYFEGVNQHIDLYFDAEVINDYIDNWKEKAHKRLKEAHKSGDLSEMSHSDESGKDSAKNLVREETKHKERRPGALIGTKNELDQIIKEFLKIKRSTLSRMNSIPASKYKNKLYKNLERFERFLHEKKEILELMIDIQQLQLYMKVKQIEESNDSTCAEKPADYENLGKQLATLHAFFWSNASSFSDKQRAQIYEISYAVFHRYYLVPFDQKIKTLLFDTTSTVCLTPANQQNLEEYSNISHLLRNRKKPGFMHRVWVNGAQSFIDEEILNLKFKSGYTR
jgi:hypothetical protein